MQERDNISKNYPASSKFENNLLGPDEKWFKRYVESKLNDIWVKKELKQLKPYLTPKNFRNNIVPPYVSSNRLGDIFS